jgi:hypothetical protein
LKWVPVCFSDSPPAMIVCSRRPSLSSRRRRSPISGLPSFKRVSWSHLKVWTSKGENYGNSSLSGGKVRGGREARPQPGPQRPSAWTRTISPNKLNPAIIRSKPPQRERRKRLCNPRRSGKLPRT